MKILAVVSMAQLLVHVASARKAIRDQVPYDTPSGHGKPENVARDMWNPALGSGMAAPWPVLGAQAIGILMLFGKPRPWVGRALGWLGCGYIYGYLSERSVRASFRHPDMKTTPLTVLGTVLSIAMALSGLARPERSIDFGPHEPTRDGVRPALREHLLRRLQVESRIELQAPASKVFDFVADHTNAPRWQSGIDEIRRITPGPIGVGTEHELTRRFAGMKVVARNRFIDYEPGRFVAFEIPSGKMTGVASYLVEPTGANSCRLISNVDFQVAGLARFAIPILTLIFKREDEKALATLKVLMEHA